MRRATIRLELVGIVMQLVVHHRYQERVPTEATEASVMM